MNYIGFIDWKFLIIVRNSYVSVYFNLPKNSPNHAWYFIDKEKPIFNYTVSIVIKPGCIYLSSFYLFGYSNFVDLSIPWCIILENSQYSQGRIDEGVFEIVSPIRLDYLKVVFFMDVQEFGALVHS